MATEFGDLRLSLTGLEETLKALKQYDPEARKQLFSALTVATRLIRDDARRSVSSLPVPSGWRNQRGFPQREGSWKNRELTRGGKGWPPWEVDYIKKKIKAWNRKRPTSKGSIITSRATVGNVSSTGAMYEFAKKSHRSADYPWVNSTPFIDKLGSMTGGRILWAAAERQNNAVQTQIIDALHIANAKLQAAFDTTGAGEKR